MADGTEKRAVLVMAELAAVEERAVADRAVFVLDVATVDVLQPRHRRVAARADHLGRRRMRRRRGWWLGLDGLVAGVFLESALLHHVEPQSAAAGAGVDRDLFDRDRSHRRATFRTGEGIGRTFGLGFAHAR